MNAASGGSGGAGGGGSGGGGGGGARPPVACIPMVASLQRVHAAPLQVVELQLPAPAPAAAGGRASGFGRSLHPCGARPQGRVHLQIRRASIAALSGCRHIGMRHL